MPARSRGKGARTASSAIVGDTECSKAPSGAADELLSGPFDEALERKLPDTHVPASGRVSSDQEVIRLRNVVEFRFNVKTNSGSSASSENPDCALDTV